jgi:hypothetical protein
VRNGKDQEKSLLAAGYNRVATVKSHTEADALADEQYGGRMNPGWRPPPSEVPPGYKFKADLGDRLIYSGPYGDNTFLVPTAFRSGASASTHRVTAREQNRALWEKLRQDRRAAGWSEADIREAERGVRGERNPKLLVLNPASDAFVAKVERILKRTLSAEERGQLGTARKEYRAFHGRDPDSLVPVEVPKGTPRFVNYVGDTDRLDYTVRADSERKGKWTHKAGDHGRSSKETKPALLVSVPGKKAPPIFAQRSDSDMYFKPTHGVMG